jgi:hypothetical protein
MFAFRYLVVISLISFLELLSYFYSSSLLFLSTLFFFLHSFLLLILHILFLFSSFVLARRYSRLSYLTIVNSFIFILSLLSSSFSSLSLFSLFVVFFFPQISVTAHAPYCSVLTLPLAADKIDFSCFCKWRK